ncbi:FtsW/RodA/SpoVE family cell cycle protein [Thermotoga profunda]|uniref:FtsW/RodA/SpoVE family cell cycle protein n=1 Tax=Thermotoga profunda TaxID=1508420 RepID=UPI0005978A8A|nr:FtsW/RodA/SpoVE family cell cycle protein [Thermotoga profunda]
MSNAVPILLIVSILISVGLILIASFDIASQMSVFGSTSSNLFYSHIVKLLIGAFLMTVTMMMDYRIHIKFAQFYYFLAIGLLLMPFFLPEINGSNRWITLAGFTFQPSEFAKIVLIISLSTYISHNKEHMREFYRGFLKPLLLSSPLIILILIEPDLSTSLILFFLVLLLLYSHGTRGAYVFMTVLLIFVLFYLALKTGFLLKDYQLWRLRTFLQGDHPDQVSKAIQALREGGWAGKGVGLGEVKLAIPAIVSDFILAAAGEEFGIIGIIIITTLFFLLVSILLRFVEKFQDAFVTSYITGFSFLIILQVLVNLGVVTGTLPVTGVTLPFLSYGGSSIMMMLAGLGIVINIVTHGSEEN